MCGRYYHRRAAVETLYEARKSGAVEVLSLNVSARGVRLYLLFRGGSGVHIHILTASVKFWLAVGEGGVDVG